MFKKKDTEIQTLRIRVSKLEKRLARIEAFLQKQVLLNIDTWGKEDG
tara:strand:- start:1204 stop:1344 length:141 start_codon:yes stop_codon:yes gene_type:complete